MATKTISDKFVSVKHQLQRITSTASRAAPKIVKPISKPTVSYQTGEAKFSCPSPLKERLLACSPDVPRFDFAGQSFWVRLQGIHDGDSLCVTIELDSKMYRMMTRLIGIDTPEIRTRDLEEKKLAIAARNRVANWALPEHFQVDGVYSEKDIRHILANNPVLLWMKCRENDKFGRVLTELFKDANENDCINSLLLAEGHGDAYEGGTKIRSWD